MPRSAEPSSTDDTLRAFFAVELSLEARNAADDVASELRGRAGGDGIKWVKPKNFHVTLRFLGELPRSRVSAVAQCAAGAIASAPGGHEPFEMRLGELAAFPSLQRPRVVTLNISPHPELEALANSVLRGVEEAGFPPEQSELDRRFRSHLTLGRVRRGGRAPSLAATRPTDPAPSQVKEIVLFRSDFLRSERGRTGPTYTRLKRIPLVKRNS